MKQELNDLIAQQANKNKILNKQEIDSQLPAKIQTSVTNQFSRQLPGVKTDVQNKINSQLPAKITAEVDSQLQSKLRNQIIATSNTQYADLIQFAREQILKSKDITTFCKNRQDGQYNHPGLAGQKINCFQNSVEIGSISNEGTVYGSIGIQITPTVFHQFYLGDAYACKSLVLRDYGTTVTYQDKTYFKGINRLTTVLVFQSRTGIRYKWGFRSSNDQVEWRKADLLDKDLNKEFKKTPLYSVKNPHQICIKDDESVNQCYRELTINLDKNNDLFLYGIWDIQSIAKYDETDNKIQYFYRLYCQN